MADLAEVLHLIQTLPREDRIQLAQAIWDGVAEEPGDWSLSEAERQEVDRRLADFQEHPERMVPAEQVLARLEAKLRS